MHPKQPPGATVDPLPPTAARPWGGEGLLRALLLLLALTACGGDSDASPPVTTATPATVTTSTTTTSTTVPETTTTTIDLVDEERLTYAEPGTVEAELETAYWRTWDAFYAAAAVADPAHPALDDAYTDPLLSDVRSNLQDLVEQGIVARPGENDQYTILSIEVVDEATGIVESCEVDTGFGYRPEDPSDPVFVTDLTLHRRAEFRLEDGRWKRATGEVLNRTEGIGGCVGVQPA